MKKVIKIFIHAGIVIDVQDIPPEIVVQVFDRDIDGVNSERLVEENGIAYYFSQWEKQED